MSDLNRAMIIGRLGADPETRHMPNGKAVTNIRVATSEKRKDRETGDAKERTEWHTVIAFDKLAEIMSKYLRKGSQVYIEGKLQTRKWQDKSGADRYSTEIVASQMQMLGPKADAPRQAEPVKQTAGVHDDEFGDTEIPF